MLFYTLFKVFPFFILGVKSDTKNATTKADAIRTLFKFSSRSVGKVWDA